MKEDAKASYGTVDAFIEKEIDLLMKQVYDCALINNFFWGVWALSLLTPDIYAKDGIFNYDFASARVGMYQKILEEMKNE